MTYTLLTTALLSLSVCLAGTVRFARARSDERKPSGRAAGIP